MKRDILVFLFLLGILFFNWPFLAIFEQSLAAYLFGIWFLYICLMFLASFRSEREDGGN